jgi:septal ring factor EnvC (AmiA/AmiB activator)
MRFRILVTVLLFSIYSGLSGQTKAELEERRNKTLDEIAYVDNLLKNTAKEKDESMNDITIIGKKLTLRESMILDMQEEINLLSDRIDLNVMAIDMMERDLTGLKNDYRRAVINSFKAKKGNPEIVYLLSAKDFNQGYKRLKYLQQVTKYRRRESEIILELKSQIETSKDKLQKDFIRISELKAREEQQKRVLQEERENKERMIRSLINKEKELEKELQEKKRIARKIESEINKIIEDERKKTIKSDNTPEQKIIGASFEENRGTLPWPVERGIITSHFGIQKHPVLKYLEENNIGIEITSSGKVSARSVFQGEVVNVFLIRGANMTVILRHGKYLSVYANLINTKVKKGDMVSSKQELGEVYPDPGSNNNSVLKFMIYEIKYLNPEEWIIKN